MTAGSSLRSDQLQQGDKAPALVHCPPASDTHHKQHLHRQDLEEQEQTLRLENDQFRQRFDLDDNVGNPDGARLKFEVR